MAPSSHDHPISENQAAIIEWLAGHKGGHLPTGYRDSNKLWWKTLNQLITRHDIDVATTIMSDYSKRANLADPVQVVGLLKFNEEIRKSGMSHRDAQIEQAKEMLIKGVSPFAAMEQFDFTDKEIGELIIIVEATGHLIEGDY